MNESNAIRWGHPRLFFEEVGSTNDVARQEAEKGAPEGLMVVAAGQAAGRGRRGRSWLSNKGEGLYLSVVLRPAWPAEEVGWLAMLGGVAVAEALEEAGVKDIRLKWPNDVLVRERKIAGILVEPRLGGGRIEFAVMGIGVNVSQGTDAWTGELEGQATSCFIEGVDTTCDRVEQMVVRRLERTYRVAAAKGFDMLLKQWVSRGGANKKPAIQ